MNAYQAHTTSAFIELLLPIQGKRFERVCVGQKAGRSRLRSFKYMLPIACLDAVDDDVTQHETQSTAQKNFAAFSVDVRTRWQKVDITD